MSKVSIGEWLLRKVVKCRMKQLVSLLTDLIVKHTPFKGVRHKIGSLATIIGVVLLIATGQMQAEIGTPLIVLAINDLFAGDHKP